METKLYQKLDTDGSLFYNQLGLLSQIVIGGFPLDIGTSLAFESIFKAQFEPYDPDRKIPNPININNYDVVLVNLRTLFRNVFSSLKPDEARLVSGIQYRYLLEFEIDIIKNLLAIEGGAVARPIFYCCDYGSVYRGPYPPEVRIRKPETPKQELYAKIMKETMTLFLKEYKPDPDVVHFTNTIDVKCGNNALIITHIPYDLFSYTLYKKMDLLESYTGVLKPRYLWPSKYYQGKDYPNIPFNKKLIKVLGDSEMFHPFLSKYRTMIKELSVQFNWSPLTTSEKVSFDILHYLKDKEFREILLKL